MGTPWFQIKNERYPEKIYAFSSNYELYASMSARVMNCLEELAPRVEQYSIDEMFLDLTGVEHCMELEDFGRQLRQHVYDCTRLTIGVGAGPTKTLAKSAVGLKRVETVPWCARTDPGESSANAETAFTAAGRRDLGRGKPYCTQAPCTGYQDRARSGPDEPGLHPEKFLRRSRANSTRTERGKLHVA